MSLGRPLPWTRAASMPSSPAPAPAPAIVESYEYDGAWPGTAAPPAPVWGAPAIVESYETAEGWPT